MDVVPEFSFTKTVKFEQKNTARKLHHAAINCDIAKII